ncbi:MAG: hypothetical protein ACT4P6_12650 [Gemmatimonadaceae bacterium]
MHPCCRTVFGLLLVVLPIFFGCSLFRSRPPARSEAVDFEAHAEIVVPGDSLLLVRVIAKNSGSATWALQLGHCSMNVRVAAQPPASSREWNYGRWSSAVNPRALCVGALETLRLPPGKSISSPDLERIVRVRDVLGDSLPPGRYRVTAFLEFNNQAPIHIAAGDVELRARNWPGRAHWLRTSVK